MPHTKTRWGPQVTHAVEWSILLDLGKDRCSSWLTLATDIWQKLGPCVGIYFPSSSFFFVFLVYLSIMCDVYFLFVCFIFFILLYNTVLVFPYIDMNLPWVCMSSQSWTPLPPPSPYHLSGSSQCTSPKHPVSCIKPRLAILFLHDSIHVSMPFSQIIPPSPSPTESKSLFYTSVSLLLSCIQGYHYHLSKFHIYVLVYCISVFLSGLLHSV